MSRSKAFNLNRDSRTGHVRDMTDFRDYAKEHGIDFERKDTRFELAHLITEARIHAGLSQQQLAERMGTHQPDISRVESGRQEPSVSFLERVAKAVGAELTLPTLTFPLENK